MTNRILLVGGGHGHLHTLKRTGALTALGAKVTLLSPSPAYHYSGMGPGLLSGLYHEAGARIDVASMVKKGGGEFVEGAAASVDPKAKTLLLQDGRVLEWDMISFGIGSVPKSVTFPEAALTIPVTPLQKLVEAKELLLGLFKDGPARVAVLGGGAAGVEIAGNLASLARGEKANIEVTLFEGAERILPAFPARASELAARALSEQGVTVRTGVQAKGPGPAPGGAPLYHLALNCLGQAAQPFFSASGLSTAKDGSLIVSRFLSHQDFPGIFALGNCASVENIPIPRAGVFAVRQAPILYRNLRAALGRGAPIAYRHDPGYMLILNLGDSTGLFIRGDSAHRSSSALYLKRFIDWRFISKYQ